MTMLRLIRPSPPLALPAETDAMEANQKAEIARAFKQMADLIRATSAQSQVKQPQSPPGGAPGRISRAA
jgi:hypothetical protein